ncbi:MAG: SDR family NAD(P)-dependent oxidoreductase [Sediminicola sp.]
MPSKETGASASKTISENKIALVTGANKGVGFQIAKALSDNGYIVYIASRNLKNGAAAATEIGGKARTVQLDVTDPGSIEKAVLQLAQDFGHLNLLVNNAGISHAGGPDRTLEDIMAANRASIASLDEMRTVWETNVFGALAVTQASIPLLKNAKSARIVNISSGLGSLQLNMDPGNPWRKHFEVVYGASKTALNAITVALAIELEESNIKVNAVTPSFTATALNNFQGTDSVEVGSREPVRVALEEDGPTGTFTGPDREVFPW